LTSGSPYRDRRVQVALILLAAVGLGLILLINAVAEGGTRTAATIGVAVGLWLALTAVLRLARRR
jgi:hypothetical protein